MVIVIMTDSILFFIQILIYSLIFQALQYNVPRGKLNRGLATVVAYKTLCNPSALTPANVRRANYLGWCVELVGTFIDHNTLS